MLLYLLIPCFSFILFLKSLPLKQLPPWASEMRLMSFWFWKELSSLAISVLVKIILSRNIVFLKSDESASSNMENCQENSEISVLDLPELALECILEKLPPSGLCNLSGVCSSFKDRCRTDYLWEKHMKQKWGKIIGPAAHREWKWHIASGRNFFNIGKESQNGVLSLFSLFWPMSWMGSQVVSCKKKKKRSFPVDSIMSWYLALENGKFWFPAQVHNRENGHVGFMLSCYDAELCYDCSTDTFQARYPPHGRRAMAVENNVPWERLRAPPVETPPHDLHISDCLNDLHPGDHIEIQWRRNKEFPYGWWYGVVGHLESCDGNEIYCRCHENDTVVLEFNQYAPGSRWRCTRINRKDHREEGNEADGFYGGIRRLTNRDEISTWKHLWPAEILE